MRRREELILLCDAQRAEIARCVEGLAVPMRLADAALSTTRYVRRHALIFGVAAAVISVLQRRRLWGMARTIIGAWRSYSTLPLALGASMAGLAVSRRQGLLKWLQRARAAWRAYRVLRGLQRTQ